jgi:prepilin-type N-terminal cleavage/methylation domain-containing protein
MRIRYRCKGFTYIELAIAMAIIALIVLGFTQLFLRSAVSVRGMKFQSIAYNFAASRMEELKMTLFDGIGNPWFPNIWETQAQTVSGNNFTRNVTISQLEASLKRVDIEVIWTEEGQNRNIEISSLVSRF